MFWNQPRNNTSTTFNVSEKEVEFVVNRYYNRGSYFIKVMPESDQPGFYVVEAVLKNRGL